MVIYSFNTKLPKGGCNHVREDYTTKRGSNKAVIKGISSSRHLQGKYLYLYVYGIYLKRNWGGKYENVAVLVAMAVNEDGYREVIGASEGMREDKASWLAFLKSLRARALEGVKLFMGTNVWAF